MLDELKQSSLDVDVELGVKPNQNIHPPEIRMDNIQRHRKATPQFPNQTTTCGVLKLARLLPETPARTRQADTHQEPDAVYLYGIPGYCLSNNIPSHRAAMT